MPFLLGAFVIAYLVAFALTPVTRRVAHRFGILDQPGGRKQHDAPTPYLGGLAMFCGVAAGAVVLLAFHDARNDPLSGPLWIGIAAATVLGLIGLADDVWHLPAGVRLVAQLLGGVGAWFVGFKVLATPWVALDFSLTVIWIVGITNAFNLLDNMDGLSAGLAGVGALSFAALAGLGELWAVGVTAAALAGAAFGFLGHNRHPAKVFMGDAGALFLGFLLSLIAISLKFENLVKVTFLVPVVVLGLPIFDTTLVVLSRLKNGRSPFTAGRDHVSHRLVRVGLPVTAAVGLLYWSGLCLGWLGLVISRSNVQVGWMLLGFVVALGLFFGVLLWRVPVYETATGPADPEAERDEELLPAR